MRLFLVEDHPLMRLAIRNACQEDSGWEIVGETDSGVTALELIPHLRPEIIVLDLMLKDVSGFVVAERAQTLFPAVRILVLSEWLKEYVVLRLEEIGVQGYLSKAEGNHAVLRAALKAVSGGGTYFSENFRRLKRERCADPLGAAKILTRMERRVLALVGDCRNDGQIADLLDITSATAQWHRSQLRHKLGLKGTPQLIAYAQQNGFALAAADIVSEIAHEAIAERAAS